MSSVAPNKKMLRIVIGATVGNLTEWYDFLLYGFLASTISQLFFPTQNKLISLTLTFTVFALSFFVRPLGGILFGWIGDRYGRQRALIISLLMMGIPTFLISCLPTYQTIGIMSPLLLLLFRLCQGLSAGGEHTGSAVYISELASRQHRTFWLSTVPTSAAFGIVLSSLIAFLILHSFTEAELLAWGWRVGYWIGAGMSVISIFLRISMPETPYFKEIQNKQLNKRYSIGKLIKDKSIRKNLLIVMALASSWGVFYQILYIWMPTYLSQIQHFKNAIALQINTIFILSFALLILLVGFIADYVKPKLILLLSCMLMMVFAYPLFNMLSSGSLRQVIIAMSLFTLIFSLYLPTAFISMVESFRTEIRYTGLSFGFNLGLALFGGTCPLVVTGLIHLTNNNSSPAFYMIFAAFIAFLVAYYGLADENDFELSSAVSEQV